MKITMYSTSWCPDCTRVRKYFSVNDIKYDEIDIEQNSDAAQKVKEINDGNQSVPTIIVESDNDTEKKILVEPSWEELEDAFGYNKL